MLYVALMKNAPDCGIRELLVRVSTHDKQPPIHLAFVAYVVADGNWNMSVSDNGIGITKDPMCREGLGTTIVSVVGSPPLRRQQKKLRE